MSASQRRKGAAGEREFFAWLSAFLGVKVTRNLGQARDGGGDGETGGILWEVKRRRKIGAARFLDQARAAVQRAQQDTDRQMWPVVAMREDGGRWMVLMNYTTFLGLVGPQMAARMRSTL